ncbi:MAG: polyvinylalcohol dehydrogenase [Planctomycetaceae bacterium]|nr:polyvinylalcohol dehydrogenase [Planctomycetaceae bacterium]
MSTRYPLLAAVLLFASTALAEDWPTFRGPNRDGVSTEVGLLKSWPKDGPKLVWTAKNLGIGWGTPSVADGKIFGIGTRGGKDGIWAVTEKDGKELWFTPFADPAEKVQKQTNGPGSTPTYHKGKLYVVSHNGTVAAFDAAKGKELWSKSYISDFGGKLPAWGFNDSVLIDDDKVICAPGSPKAALAALKPDTGATIWTTDAGDVSGGQGYSSPVKATIGGVPMYVILTGAKGGLIGVNAATGKVLWQYKNTPAAGGVAQIPIPVIKGDLIWVSCSYGGGAALLQIVPAGKDKFEVKEIKTYIKKDLNNHHGGMVLVGDHIYFGHDQNQGYPVCVEFKTGEIKWGPIQKNSDFAGGMGSAAVLSADGRLYFRYQNGVMVLTEPSPESLKVVSSFKLPPPNEKSYSQSWPHPVIANGKLYIRDQNVMYSYSVKADKN